MKKISLIVPSHNNLRHLKNLYTSVKKHAPQSEVILLDDGSNDGTWEWMQEITESHQHREVKAYRSNERVGHTVLYDKGIKMATNDIVGILHADMIIGPNYVENLVKHLKPRTVVCATRIEPPLHPSGPEKITQAWGNEVEEFDFNTAMNGIAFYERSNENKTTEGIFAPWCMYREDFLAIGGHDKLFAPQSKEDSDLFNRFVLNGYEIIQSWDALVYHFTSRGSRFNKHAGGGAGTNSQEWIYTTTKNGREFIRKWGHFIKHDALMKPIIPPKYNIAFVVTKCNLQLLEVLEPWCDRIYIEDEMGVLQSHYYEKEQPNTLYDLSKRVLSIKYNDPIGENDIVVEFDATKLNNDNFQYIQQLPEIIKDNGEVGDFVLDIFKVSIYSMEEYQQNLIKILNLIMS